MKRYSFFHPSAFASVLEGAKYLSVGPFLDTFQEDSERGPGFRVKVMYPNGYGISAVKHEFLHEYYAWDDWEVAIIHQNGDYDEDIGFAPYYLDYDTPITDDVECYLSDEDVVRICEQVRKL